MSALNPPHIVYLHGFLSSPASKKAQEMAQWMHQLGLTDHFHCPELPPTPQEIGLQLQALFTQLKDETVCVVGSSLGGFYATWAVESFGCRAVLINPAVRPYTLLKDYIGLQRNYQTGAEQWVDASIEDDLRAFERLPTQLEKYWLMVQTGDKTLDYRDAVNFYAGCRQSVMAGGDHSYVGFADVLPLIWKFAQGDE